MSLLLDALRRAGSARGDDIAEPVNQRPAGDDNAAGTARAEEFDLDIDAATAAQTDASPGATAGASLKGPARAEAVFRGGASGGSVIRTAALFTLGAFVLLGGLLMGGWYYYDSTRSAVDRELVRYTPEPEAANDRATGADTAADGAEPSAEEALDPDALDAATVDSESTDTDGANPQSGTDTADAEVDAAAALAAAPQSGTAAGGADSDAGGADKEPSAETASANGDATAGDAGTAAAGADEGSGSGAASKPASDDTPDDTASAQTGNSGTSAKSSDNRTSNDDVRAEAEASDGPLVRSTAGGDGRSPLAQALQEGYRALRRGDLMAARRHYREAVELGPSNRDARLGAAAVAQRQGNAAAAIEHYRKVLADHPRDPYARSGLASLESTGDPRRIESELKTLLKQEPNAHALRYALGNLYAREDRWSQAQSAYFEAFRTAPKEADYAFNLAVALDRLGQREAAVKYYGEALDLAGDGSASFPLESARSRMESLSR